MEIYVKLSLLSIFSLFSYTLCFFSFLSLKFIELSVYKQVGLIFSTYS